MDIKLLKDNILQLAIQGKLVEQNTDDEPASVLIERIKTEKQQLIKERKTKKEKELVPITDYEKGFELPCGWEWIRLGDISFKITDGSHNPPKGEENVTEYLMLSSQNINGNKIVDLMKCRYLSKENYELEDKRTQVKTGDILLTIVGTIGRSCIFQENLKVVLQRSVGVIDTKYCNDYLKYLFDSPKIQEHFNSNATGTAQKGIYLTQLKQMVIPLPPLQEQKRIVAKINELFALVGELDSSKKDLLQNLGYTKNKILQLAIRGKLVEQNIDDEPAKFVLQKISVEKENLIKERRIKKESLLPEINEDEKPFELPDGWEWVRLGSLVTKLGAGSTPLGGSKIYVDEGIKFIRSQNIRNDGLKLEDIVFIPEYINEKMKGSIVEKGDVLLNITGASIGRSCVVGEDFDTANVNQHVSIIRLVEKNMNKFIHYVIISDYFQKLIMDVQVGVSREGLSMTKLREFLIPLPPLEEQERIVEKVNALMKYLDALEGELSS